MSEVSGLQKGGELGKQEGEKQMKSKKGRISFDYVFFNQWGLGQQGVWEIFGMLGTRLMQ